MSVSVLPSLPSAPSARAASRPGGLASGRLSRSADKAASAAQRARLRTAEKAAPPALAGEVETQALLEVLTGGGPTYLPASVLAAFALLAVHPSRTVSGADAGDATAVMDSTADLATGVSGPSPAHALTVDGSPVVGREMSVGEWPVVAAQLAGRSVRDTPRAWIAEELVLIEAVEQVKAWADFQGLAALRRMRDAVGAECEALYDQSHWTTARMPEQVTLESEADSATVDEVALATGLPEHTVWQRLRLACAPLTRCSTGLSLLAAGRTSLDRLTRIQSAAIELADDDVAVITRRVLAEQPPEPPADDDQEPHAATDDVDAPRPRSHAWFTRALRRQVVLHQLDPVVTHEQQLARRTVFGQLDDDGTGSLTITGDGPRVTAALDRVDRIARHLRATGDARTLTQLRSDAALDLLLTGWAPATPAVRARRANAGADASGTANESSGGPEDDSWGTGTLVGAAPQARVTIVMSLTTLLGLDEDTAEVPGHGYLPAALARQAALAQGSTWARLVVDRITGTALDLSTHHYRPTAEMAAFVAALDDTCRAPGCAVPAARCDLDHTVEWPTGATTVTNLAAVHRRHHNHKTRHTWTCQPVEDARDLVLTGDPFDALATAPPPLLPQQDRGRPDPFGAPDDATMRARLTGTLRWTTLAGRRYTTARHDHLDPDRHQADGADHETTDRLLTLGPPPF